MLMRRPAALRGLLRLRGGCKAALPSMSAHGAAEGAVKREPRVIEGETLGPVLLKMRRSLSRARDTSALCVIADFDWTLTAFWGPNGERSDQCHDFILHRCSPSSEWSAEVQAFRALARERFGERFGAERPKSEQIALAEWWWTSANKMMLKHNLTQADVREAVQNANTSPRPGAMALLTACISQGIPVAIVSAGLSCVIEEFVRKHDASGSLLSSPLFSIHANVLEFDATGTLIDFGPHQITTRNKRDALSQCQHMLSSRKHVLLLGDNLNDVDVVDKAPSDVSIIKVGYANAPDVDVSQYLARYDAVVTGDGPMDYVHELVERLVSKLDEQG